VDHEVEDDVDVERARGEDAEAVGLEEHGPVEGGEGGGDGGVEALEMSNRKYAVALSREGDEVVGFGEGGGEGFFDEDVDVGEEELFRDGGVVDGGDADGGGVDGGWRGEELLDGGEGRDVVGSGVGLAARGVGVDDGGELEEVGVSGLQLAVDAEVIAAEGAGADDGDAKWGHGGYLAVGVGDSTASRQRA
jgi:hypothetical protein